MKKKLITTLTALLVFTNVVPMTVYSKETSTLEAQEENNNIDMSKIKEDINGKANMLVSNSCKEYSATSVQYAINDGDNIIVSDNAKGDYSKDEKITQDNMYGIGSVSKMFTTAAVMQLVDEKKIDLDLPVINYIPEFEMDRDEYFDYDYKKITPRMLLNHSSGISGAPGKNGLLFKDYSTESHDNLLENLKSQKLLSDPGQFSAYSNGGFALAQVLVERVSNMNFSDYLKKNITGPLGLKHTKTSKECKDNGLLAKTYSCSKAFNKADKNENGKTETTRKEKTFEDPYETPEDGIGVAGIFSSAEDLCKFGRSLVKKDGTGLLQPRSVELMGEKEYLKGLWVDDPEEKNRDNGSGYGLGWDCVKLYPFNRYGIKAYVKHGSTLFYNSCLIVLPDLNITMAVTSSGGSSSVDQSFAVTSLIELLKSKGIIKEDYDSKNSDDDKWPGTISKDIPSYINNNEYGGVYNYGDRTVNVEIGEDGTLTITKPEIIEEKNESEDNNKDTKGTKPTQDKYTYSTSGYFIKDRPAEKDDSKEKGSKEEDNSIVGIKFVKEENGKIYMEQKLYNNYPGLEKYSNDVYVAEKVFDIFKDNKDLKDLWAKRSKKPYYVLDAKSSSALYSGSLHYGANDFKVDEHGYIDGSKIINEQEAIPAVQIPGTSTMQLENFKFYTENGIEYLDYNGNKFISGDNIGTLSNDDIAKKRLSVDIDDSGYTKWFKVAEFPNDYKEVTMTVKHNVNEKNKDEDNPKPAFTVYSPKGECIYDSYVGDLDSEVIKGGDVVCFAGGSGDDFEISFE